MPVDRTAVLVRFPPDLLERVDDLCGVRKRHPVLLEVIEAGLDELERGSDLTANYGYVPPVRGT